MPHRDEIHYTQNFLHSPALVDRLVSMAKLPRGGTVLEIGPGKGIITRKLADAVGADGQVIAVELDDALAEALKTKFADIPQLRIVKSNILSFDFGSLPRDHAVFANIPFNITSLLLELLFTPATGPAQAHLILQQDTLIATSEYGTAETFKSMLLRPLYDISVAHTFHRTDFTPQPGVDTALFAFFRRATPLIDAAHYELYKDFLAAVSKDRVGEGIWSKLFSRAQLHALDESLVLGRGLKSQSVAGIVDAFRMFTRGSRAKFNLVRGTMNRLREEQARRESINRSGDHRRKHR